MTPLYICNKTYGYGQVKLEYEPSIDRTTKRQKNYKKKQKHKGQLHGSCPDFKKQRTCPSNRRPVPHPWMYFKNLTSNPAENPGKVRAFTKTNKQTVRCCRLC